MERIQFEENMTYTFDVCFFLNTINKMSQEMIKDIVNTIKSSKIADENYDGDLQNILADYEKYIKKVHNLGIMAKFTTTTKLPEKYLQKLLALISKKFGSEIFTGSVTYIMHEENGEIACDDLISYFVYGSQNGEVKLLGEEPDEILFQYDDSPFDIELETLELYKEYEIESLKNSALMAFFKG